MEKQSPLAHLLRFICVEEAVSQLELAYNQTAADNLLANGFSQYTSPEQQYALPSTTQVKLVNDAISTWYAQADTTAAPTSLMLALALVVGVVIIVGSVFAFKKLKST